MVNQRISEHEYAIQNPIPFHLSNKYIKVPQHYWDHNYTTTVHNFCKAQLERDPIITHYAFIVITKLIKTMVTMVNACKSCVWLHSKDLQILLLKTIVVGDGSCWETPRCAQETQELNWVRYSFYPIRKHAHKLPLKFIYRVNSSEHQKKTCAFATGRHNRLISLVFWPFCNAWEKSDVKVIQ